MTTISIDFRQLESAARSMRYAASDMESYADGLPRRVQNPASALGAPPRCRAWQALPQARRAN